MKKKIISFTLALGMVLSSSASVLAQPSVNEINNQLQQDKSLLNKATKDRQGIEAKVELLDNQTQKLRIDINNTKIKINKTQNYIKSAEKEIKKAEEDMAKEQELFDERMRAMYMNGTNGMMGYLSVILDSKSMSDLISRVQIVKKIADLDKKIINDLNVKKDEVEKKKSSLEDENKKLEALKLDNEQKLAKLNKDKKELTKLIAEARSEESKYKNKINDAKKQIKKISDAAPKYVPSRGAANISSNAIVAYANNFKGVKYVYGANGPNSFDCSGFTKYVFAHFGVRLNRVAAAQATQGTYVSRGNLQAGDLVFFGPGNIHHVGIYVGNGCYIHAPHTGDVVKISSLAGRSDFAAGRRVR